MADLLSDSEARVVTRPAGRRRLPFSPWHLLLMPLALL